MTTKRMITLFAGAAALASMFTFTSAAQTANTLMFRVTTTHVKPDMVTEWVDLQKNEVVPALKKGGVKSRTVFVSGLFGNSYEYTVVEPIESFAQFDSPSPLTKALDQPGARRLNEKLRKCIVSQSSYVGNRWVDLSNVVEEPPKFIVSTRFRIAPGKMTDFQNLVKSELLPVYKKNKIGFTVTRRTLGANTNDVTISIAYQKYADLDGGPVFRKLVGADAADKINAKFTGIRNPIETVVRSRVADLSF